jgi:acetoin utilization deacetylase AcuC-like enzyme
VRGCPAIGVSTVYSYDERCLAHDNGSMILDERAVRWLEVPHCERPERLARTMSVLADAGVLERLTRLDSRFATRGELGRVHAASLIDAVESACARGEHAWIGPEARVGPDSWDAILLAAGNVLAVTDAVLDGTARNGLALVRPPGHHTTADTAMGFCLFNNVALAARHAQARDGVDRIAIVDWDVHHGNGTEAIFDDDPSVLFISLHQADLYPIGAGALEHTGVGEGEGFTVNLPLPAGSGDDGYLLAFDRVVEPALAAFEPDLLLVSAGQDPAASDPLGRMSVTSEGFRTLAERAKGAAERLCDGRLAVALEGGYSLAHLPFCNLAIAEALAGLEPSLDGDPLELDVPRGVREFERLAVERVRAAHASGPLLD